MAVENGVAIPAGCICLPHFHQCIWYRPVIFIEHATGYDDAFPQRLAVVLLREVVIARADVAGAEDGPVSSDSVYGGKISGCRGERFRVET